MKTEEIHKELDLIQSVINRTAANSFVIKKWLIALLTLILVFKHEELLGGNLQLIPLLALPIVCFWYLDAFFLSTERLYREMYKWVVANRPHTDKYLYDLNTMQRQTPDGETVGFRKKKNRIIYVMFSSTLFPFYLLPLVFVVLYGLVVC